MPARSKVLTLPDSLRADLDRRLIAGGFGDYSALSDWLKENGYEISRSAIHRYGREFEERLSAIKVATEQAQAISEAAADDAGNMNDALVRLCQEKAFQVLVKMTDLDPENVDINKMGIMVARLTRASVAQKRWMAEAREKAKKTVERVEKKLSGVIDPETLRRVREDIYGIVT